MSLNTLITTRKAVALIAETEMNLPILMNGSVQFNKNFVGGNGSTIDVIIPGYGVTGVGADMTNTPRSYTAGKQSVTLVQRHTPVSLTQIEMSQDLSDFEEQVAVPFGAQHASTVQKVAALEMIMKADTAVVNNTGTGAASAASFNDLGVAISSIRSARSTGNLHGVLSCDLYAQVMASGINLFNPSPAISGMFTNGEIGSYHKVPFNETPDIDNLTTGTHTVTTNFVGTVNAQGTNLHLAADSLTGTVLPGEVITLANVKVVDIYAVGRAQNYAFVVQGVAGVDVYTAAANAIDLPIKQIYTTGPLTNISSTAGAFPSGAVATFQTHANSTYARGLVWDKFSFIFASAMLKPLSTVESKSAKGSALGMLIQTQSSIITGEDITRWDSLTGFLLARSNWVSSYLVLQ
jgi:hypothetical protein